MNYNFYAFQKSFVNKIITGYISNRPRIIKKVKKIFPKTDIWAKLLAGPTVEIPGPIPAKQVATELQEV